MRAEKAGGSLGTDWKLLIGWREVRLDALLQK